MRIFKRCDNIKINKGYSTYCNSQEFLMEIENTKIYRNNIKEINVWCPPINVIDTK